MPFFLRAAQTFVMFDWFVSIKSVIIGDFMLLSVGSQCRARMEVSVSFPNVEN
jgi:hypothetical protein